MSQSNQLLPNAVGRIDAIVDAIKAGDRLLTLQLLQDEHERLDCKARSMIEQINRVFEARVEVFMVINNFSKDPIYFGEIHNQIKGEQS